MNSKALDGKVVIMTGGSGLLGKEWKRALEEAGAKKVYVWDIKGDDSVDVTSEDSVKAALAGVIAESHFVDVLINAAALNPVPGDPNCAKMFSSPEEYPIDLWRKELEVGLTGAMICTKYVAKIMREQGGGSIINIGSHYGLVAPDNRIYSEGQFKSIGYAVSKGALPQFTRVWGTHLAPHNVRVNCLVLGGVQAGQSEEFVEKYKQRTPLRRMAKPGEYDDALVFLASEGSAFMTGQSLVMDGGWTAI